MGLISEVSNTASDQYHQSLNEIIIPPPRRQASMEKDRLNPQIRNEITFEDELDAHDACEGSALPLIMRRLVFWS